MIRQRTNRNSRTHTHREAIIRLMYSIMSFLHELVLITHWIYLIFRFSVPILRSIWLGRSVQLAFRPQKYEFLSCIDLTNRYIEDKTYSRLWLTFRNFFIYLPQSSDSEPLSEVLSWIYQKHYITTPTCYYERQIFWTVHVQNSLSCWYIWSDSTIFCKCPLIKSVTVCASLQSWTALFVSKPLLPSLVIGKEYRLFLKKHIRCRRVALSIDAPFYLLIFCNSNSKVLTYNL